MNKYLAGADAHIRKDRPRYRKDNYLESCLSKFNWQVQTANALHARLLIAGDIFDSVLVSTGVINSVIEVLEQATCTPIIVAGQHDLYYHSQNIEDTPIYNLKLAGVVKLLQFDTEELVTGVGWGTGVDNTIPSNAGEILLTHRCVTPKAPPPFLKDAVSAADMLKAYPQFKVIITGDYHQPFATKTRDGRLLINPGTMMRNKKDMLEYQPTTYLITEDKGEYNYEPILFPVKPADEVFDLEQIQHDEKHGMTIDTDKLKELMQDGSINELTLSDAIAQVQKLFGNKANQELIEEVLEHGKH